MYNILILDDDINVNKMLEMALSMNYQTFTARNISEGMDIVRHNKIHLCLVDLRIGTESGLDALRQIRTYDSKIVVIIMTAYADITTTVQAIKQGAYNYLTKPLDLKDLYAVIAQALEQQALHNKVAALESEIQGKYGISGMVGQSERMFKLYGQIDRLKNGEATVLINGESGTGKELVAKALHFSGKRGGGPFVAVNCAAIPETLLEDEMFGHKKGSFTGAAADAKGKFEAANHGTIFLDEIGEMPLALQAKILRVLEDRTVCPIGSNVSREIDVRVVVATNRDLMKMVEEGTFRRDLYFRLSVVTLKTPPLRTVPEDIPLLAQYYIEKFNGKYDKKLQGLAPAASEALLNYQYPGNVRELINILEYAVIFADEDYIYVENLPEVVRVALENKSQEKANEEYVPPVGKTLAEVEKEAIEDALRISGGHIGRAATTLGISDKGLRNKLVAYSIDAKRFAK